MIKELSIRRCGIQFLLITIIWNAQSATGQTTMPDRSFIDPVVLENEWLKVTVARGRGGVIRSLVHKSTGRELVEEFLWGGAWYGGFGEIILAGQGYPGGEMQKAAYKGEVKKNENETVLCLIYSSESAENNRLKFKKTFRLQNGESKIEIQWTIENNRKKDVAVTPWFHNIVHRSLAETILPKSEGIEIISGGADYFFVPHRDWLGAIDRKNRFVVYFSYDFNEMARNYYSFWNNYHSLEWVSRGKTLKPGESWVSSFCVGVVEGLENVASVTPDIVAGYNWRGDQLFLDIVAVKNMKNVEISLKPTGEKTIPWAEKLDMGPRRAATVKVPFEGREKNNVPLSFELKTNGKEILPNPTLHVMKGQTPDKVPLPQWLRRAGIYRERTAGKVVAESAGSIGPLTLWRIDPLIKVFPDDHIV